MKRLLTLVAFFATLKASAQQVNPVPDYVFRNQMSVGRGTVTDTAAYFSIGPRYGANKGFMPPIVVDTATFSSGKRNGLLIFSVQKNKFLYWDSVRVQWSDMAGSSGSYITGTLTTNYIPKATGSTTLGNSVMYDSSGHVRVYGNYVGNTNPNRLLFTSEISGNNGYTALFKQSDSITDAGQFPLILRKGLLTTDKPRPNFGVGLETQLQDDAGTWRRSGFVVNRIVDSTAANFRTKFDFRLINGSTYPIPLIISGDSSIRMAKLAGSGTRYVVADENGDISASSGTALVDTLTISTRAWRQKGLDSLAALEVSGSGTTNYVPKFTAGSTIGNSQIFDNGTSVGIGTASPNASYLVEAVKNGDVIFNLRTTSATGNSYIRTQSTTTNLYSAGITQSTGTSAPFVNDGAFQYTNGAGGMQIITGTATPIQFFTNNTERLRITSGGNVGIGISTPANNGAGETGVEIRGANYPMLTISTPTISQFSGVGLTSGYIGTSTNHPFTILSNSAERLRIFANGRIGVNTTTDAGYQLDVNGTLRSVNGANFATTSGNVGIGTASPAAKLDIAYSTNPTTATPHILLTTGGTSKQAAITAESFSVSGLVFSVGDGTLVDRMTILRSNGNVGIGTTSPTTTLDVRGIARVSTTDQLTNRIRLFNQTSGNTWDIVGGLNGANNTDFSIYDGSSTRLLINTNGEVIINTTTDAGDYKLQVSGNALVTAGKLDITTNTAFGLSVSRSGTSVVAGQINNSNGILYYGAESSTGGGLFTGSSAYAAVIGSGAAYPLQFATDNVTRATINTNGELLIATTTDNGDFKLQVNGSALVSGSIQTANPVSGTAVPWRLGSVVATNVQLDTANYVEVNINGTFYRLAIVTPL